MADARRGKEGRIAMLRDLAHHWNWPVIGILVFLVCFWMLVLWCAARFVEVAG
jgi:hypothetical protein